METLVIAFLVAFRVASAPLTCIILVHVVVACFVWLFVSTIVAAGVAAIFIPEVETVTVVGTLDASVLLQGDDLLVQALVGDGTKG